jgi:MerR family Zn(II)-responsive transcriptional regulator of zntA
MNVQEVATQTALPPQVIRYYARIGLLKPARNPSNGYRQFSARDVECVRLIRMAQKLGFTLRDIKVMLGALGTPELSEDWIRDTLKRRLMSTRRKRHELEDLERLIEKALSQGLKTSGQMVDMKCLASWMLSTLSSAAVA